MSKSYRDHSRSNWICSKEGFPGVEKINTGSLQRIADATEAMAKNYISLQNSLEHYKNRCDRLEAENQHLRNSRAAIKAHNTRLKKKLEQKNEN